MIWIRYLGSVIALGEVQLKTSEAVESSGVQSWEVMKMLVTPFTKPRSSLARMHLLNAHLHAERATESVTAKSCPNMIC